MKYRLSYVLVLTLAACGSDDVVSHSAPVGIHLAFSSGDVAGGIVGDDKNINTESGNPYGAFVAEAVDVLGHDPSRLEIDALTLEIVDGTTGVTSLGEIYDGTAVLQFQMNGTDTLVPAATIDVGPTTGAGPLGLVIGFDSATVTGDDWDSLIGGNFKVVISGPAQGDFEGANAAVDLLATFTFEALE